MPEMIKGGRVVRIRVNPADCMAVVDVLRKVGYYKGGMSFATAVSSALHWLVDAARHAKEIPTRDGFEYGEMMRDFKDQPHLDRAQKLAFTGEFKLAQLPPKEANSDPRRMDPSKRRIELKIKELHANRDAAPDSWDEEKQAQLIRLNDELMEVGEFDPNRKR